MKFKHLLFVALIGLVASCAKEDSSDVNQDKIYTVYELFYNKNTDKTVAVARFRFGGATGTLLELTSPANVLYNNDTLAYSNWYGGHVKEYAGKMQGGTFTYTNTNSQSYQNTVPAYDTVGFPADFDTISKSSAYTFTWQGGPLAANENVGLFIGSWTWGQDALVVQSLNGATNMIIGVNNMANLATGTSTAYLDRWTGVEVTEGTSEGGRIRGKYRASNKVITVVP